jgi:hypothetical protein
MSAARLRPCSVRSGRCCDLPIVPGSPRIRANRLVIPCPPHWPSGVLILARIPQGTVTSPNEEHGRFIDLRNLRGGWGVAQTRKWRHKRHNGGAIPRKLQILPEPKSLSFPPPLSTPFIPGSSRPTVDASGRRQPRLCSPGVASMRAGRSATMGAQSQFGRSGMFETNVTL